MKIVKCNIGMWKVEARLEDVNDHNRMAVISAMIDHDVCPVESRHIVVFDHVDGCDEDEEAKAIFNRVLAKAH